MFKGIFAVAAAASVSLLGVTAAATAQAAPHAPPAGQLHGVRVINLHRAYEARLGHTRPGKISGIVYPADVKHKRIANAAAACTEPACPMTWHGGAVQHTPHVYLLLWGPNWQTDPGHQASATYLENFFSGLGNNQAQDNWSTITSPYADGTGVPGFSGLVYAGAFNDLNAPPLNASNAQVGAEADTFATNQNITDLDDAQIVVATQSGTCPKGFVGAGCLSTNNPYCAYHSWSNEPYINLPYQIDAGTTCFEDFVNPAPGGNNDGWSIVGGAEYASTITDPFGTGWIDPSDSVSGGEIGGKCAGIAAGAAGGAVNLTLATGTFAVRSLWSNAAFNGGANGCVATGAIQDSVSITSPGSRSNAVGVSVNLAIQGSSAAGNPLTWSAIGLPAGLSINASTGVVTGTPTTVAVYHPTITARDVTGAHHSLQFTWTINAAITGPIKGDHGKCLDDFGSGTTNGNKVDIWTCNGTAAQRWTFSGGHLMVLGKCLNDATHTGARTKLVIWGCNDHKSQLWTHRSNGEYVLKLNGLCLTDPSGSSVNGTQVQIRVCHAYKDQQWTLPGK
jgi:hypothetical protein